MFYVSTYVFSDIRHFIHKADFSGKHAVSSIFGKLGTFNIHYNNFFMISIKWRI